MTQPDGPARTPEPAWTVAAVARYLGVAPATLRSWSRRYGVGPPGHRPGSYRRYTDTDIAELAMMCRLSASGMALPAAAAIAREHRQGAEAGTTIAPAAPRGSGARAENTGGGGRKRITSREVSTLVDAARRLNSELLLRTLGSHLARHGVLTTWNKLCRPALNRLDSESPPDACIEATLVLAWAVVTSLRRLPAAPTAAPAAGMALLACTAGEQHTLALEVLFAALVERHVPARMLGSAVPTSALLHASNLIGPAVVFLWCQQRSTARTAQLRRLLRQAVSVIAVGPGWREATLPAGVLVADSLDDALQLACRVGDLATQGP